MLHEHVVLKGVLFIYFSGLSSHCAFVKNYWTNCLHVNVFKDFISATLKKKTHMAMENSLMQPLDHSADPSTLYRHTTLVQHNTTFFIHIWGFLGHTLYQHRGNELGLSRSLSLVRHTTLCRSRLLDASLVTLITPLKEEPVFVCFFFIQVFI